MVYKITIESVDGKDSATIFTTDLSGMLNGEWFNYDMTYAKTGETTTMKSRILQQLKQIKSWQEI